VVPVFVVGTFAAGCSAGCRNETWWGRPVLSTMEIGLYSGAQQAALSLRWRAIQQTRTQIIDDQFGTKKVIVCPGVCGVESDF